MPIISIYESDSFSFRVDLEPDEWMCGRYEISDSELEEIRKGLEDWKKLQQLLKTIKEERKDLSDD